MGSRCLLSAIVLLLFGVILAPESAVTAVSPTGMLLPNDEATAACADDDVGSLMTEECTAKTSNPISIETAAVLPMAGMDDEESLLDFGYFLQSLELQTTKPDILIMYEDWKAHPIFAEMLQNASLPFPVKVVSRPKDDIHLYPSHKYNGHLKLFFWWIINTTFITTGAKQVCYLEDDTVLHPDFFTWIKHARNMIPRNDYWGLWGKEGLPMFQLALIYTSGACC